MKQLLILSIFISLLVIFWACSDSSNPITQQGPRNFDAFALWDTASYVSLGNLVQCLAVKDTFLYAGTSNVGIYRSTDNGEGWITVNTGLTNSNVRAMLVKDTNLYAGTAGGVFRSTDKGSNWTLSNSGITTSSIFALAVKDSFIFAGTSSSAFRSPDNGATWTSAGLSGETVLTFAVKGNRLFAGTSGGGVFRSNDNGSNWVPINTGLPGSTINAIAAKDTNLFVTVGTWGVYRSSNDSSWTAVNDGLNSILIGANPTSFFVYGPSVLTGISDYQGVYISLNNGASWISANAGLFSFSTYCFAYNGSYLFIGGNDGGGIGGVWRHPL